MTRIALALALVLGARSVAHADTWTVMVYLAADDVEADSVEAATAMASVSGENLTVVVQADRFGAHDGTPLPGAEPYEGSRRFVVEGGAVSPEADLGVLDASDPGTLADFVAWAYDAHPADHHALVLSGRGGAWQGATSDEHHGGRLLSASDLSRAIERGVPDGHTLDLLGFDACLLASVELIAGVAPHARWIVASEEAQLGRWDHAALLHAIVDAPAASPLDVARAIVDAESTQARAEGDPTFTLAVIDAERFEAQLMPHLDSLASAVTAAMDDERTFAELVRARASADGFGRSPPTDAFEVVDLGQFAHHLASASIVAETSIATEATAVVDALRAAVVHRAAGPLHAGAYGLSIHVPLREVDAAYEASALPFPSGASWPAFVRAYAAHASRDTSAPAITDAAFSGPVMVAHVEGDDVDRVSIVLARDEASESVFLGALPSVQGGGARDTYDGGPVRFAWAGEWPRAIDGTSDAAAPIVAVETFDDAGDHALVAMPVELDRGDGFAPGTVLFDLDLESLRGRAIGVYRAAAGRGASMARLAGTRVRVARVLLRADGSLAIMPGETVLAGDALAIAPRPTRGEGYRLGVVATDLVGNAASRFAPIAVAPIAVAPPDVVPTPSDDAELLTRLAVVSAGLLLAGVGVWLARRRRSA